MCIRDRIKYVFTAPSARDYRRYVPSELQRGNRQGEFTIDLSQMDPLLEVYVAPKPDLDTMSVAELNELEMEYYLFLVGAGRPGADQA